MNTYCCLRGSKIVTHQCEGIMEELFLLLETLLFLLLLEKKFTDIEFE